MDISTTNALRIYDQTRRATGGTAPDAAPASAPAEPSSLMRAGASFAETLRQGEETAMQAMTGRADLPGLVEALARTELAVETAVTVRDKVVEAYREILRMPV